MLPLQSGAIGATANAENLPSSRCKAVSPAHRVAVVELFTSEGCSSCPPADEWLTSAQAQVPSDQAIFLSHHVPYWDYIGWKDRFAQPLFENRQRALAQINRTSVYTPAFFISGMESSLALRGNGRLAKIAAINRESVTGQISLQAQADGQFQWSWRDLPRDWVGNEGGFYIAVTSSHESSVVSAGENNHSTLHHSEVTQLWQGPYAVNAPSGSATFSLPKSLLERTDGKIILLLTNAEQTVLQAVSLNRAQANQCRQPTA
jgi:hypothetical protein